MTDPTAPRPADGSRPSTPESPWPVRVVSQKISGWVERLGSVWVEGQLVQLNRRPGVSLSFAVLRDAETDFSLPLAVPSAVLASLTPPPTEGARIVAHAKPTFWTKRGSLQLMADEIRPVGIGELLARLEHLKRILAAEGLFAPERKKPLPFLPRAVGLICGRASKAEHDVVVNARSRWPGIEFVIREVAVQGEHCVGEVTAALAELDAAGEVDVIVVARGGGAVEDLLPFSNETLVRAAAACRTPLVSAIGHETDSPLLDLVADYRASTPTAAAKRIVPDLAEERAGLDRSRSAIRAAVHRRVQTETAALAALRSRPVLADPTWMVTRRTEDVGMLLTRARAGLELMVRAEEVRIGRLAAQVAALSPRATLARGYALVHGADGRLVRDADDVEVGAPVIVRLAGGRLVAKVISRTSRPDPTAPAPASDTPRTTR